MPHDRSRLVPASLLVLAIAAPASSQDARKEEGPSSWLPILKQQAADYAITPRDASKSPPKPLADPILRWTQPVRGGDDGAVFLWVSEGRPEAVGTIFTYRVPDSRRTIQHEVHSLALTPVDATWRGKPMWRADEPGVSFRAVPDAPEPATSAPSRLRQMQAIGRDFSAENVHEKSGKNELRLMPRPLYRYEPTDPSLVDGALFCLAHGTDPEVFLLLEDRKTKSGACEWRYALARFSDLALKARFKGKDVWSVGPGQWDRHDGVHAYYIAELVDADTPDEYRKAARDERTGDR
jgi:hypothetical protein